MPKPVRPGQRPTGRTQTWAAVRRNDPPPPPEPRTPIFSCLLMALVVLAIPAGTMTALVSLMPAVSP